MFPLFSVCSKLYDHPDGMIRNTIRHITFNCIKGTISLECIDSSEYACKWRLYEAKAPTTIFPSISLLCDFTGTDSEWVGYEKVGDWIWDMMIMMIMIMSREYTRASHIARNLSDELYILNDLTKCKMECVRECICKTLIRSLLHHTCFPVLRNTLRGVTPTTVKVCTCCCCCCWWWWWWWCSMNEYHRKWLCLSYRWWWIAFHQYPFFIMIMIMTMTIIIDYHWLLLLLLYGLIDLYNVHSLTYTV